MIRMMLFVPLPQCLKNDSLFWKILKCLVLDLLRTLNVNASNSLFC